jgi:hypothetical protein
MSNLTLITPFTKLSANEAAGHFYTHKATLTFNDCNAVPAATTATVEWNLQLITAGHAVLGTGINVVVPFVWSNASIIIGSIQVGDGSSATTYFASTTAKVQGTGATSAVAANACYANNTTVAYPVATNGQLNVTMNITTGQAFNTATAGEVDIFFRIVNFASLGYPQQN